MRKWMILAALILQVPTGQAVTDAPGGGVGSGGGDTYSQEFVALGYDILQRLTLNPIQEVDINKLSQAVVGTKVTSVDQLTLSGKDVDAINYPSAAHIDLSREGWDRLKSEPFRKTFLVFHEYLGIMGVNDADYQVSHKIDQAHICSRTREVRELIEDFFKISCDRLLISDLQKIERLNLRVSHDFHPLKADDFRYLDKMTFFSIAPEGTTSDSYQGYELPDGIFAGLHLEDLYVMRIARVQSDLFKGLRIKQVDLLASAEAVISPYAFRGLDTDELWLSGGWARLETHAFDGMSAKLLELSALAKPNEPKVGIKVGCLAYPPNSPLKTFAVVDEGAFDGLWYPEPTPKDWQQMRDCGWIQ
jgi:hypothetical protein